MPSQQADQSEKRIAIVALNLAVDKTFDYLIPETLRGRVPVGGRVYVPFGNRPRVLGYCVELKAGCRVPDARLKSIQKSLDEEPLVSPLMLRLARWMAAYYRCSLGEALHATLPAAVRWAGGRRRLQHAFLEVPLEKVGQVADDIFDRSPAQSKILRALAAAGGSAPLAHILKSTRTSRASARVLLREKLIRVEKRFVESEYLLDELRREPRPPHTLTSEQQDAYRSVTARLKAGHFDVLLLHGITSSGKTEVYLRCIADVVKSGKQAIVLVPEISLTPQSIRHLGSRFPRTAVLHSRLTQAERRQQWKIIRRGEADVVIGARSAVFAPVPKLGLLVIDEEHENSFKQDSVPRYHARDVGIMRAKYDDAIVVLSSATPSLESYRNARLGKYTLLTLRHRIGRRRLPPVEIVDMRGEWAGGGRQRVISRRLEACMRQSLGAGQQALLFLNRRGFSPFLHCIRCGFALKCPRCDITLTYHRDINVARCHYCGYQRRAPTVCPECGREGISYSGAGTERVERAVQEMFPDQAVIRMDSDSTTARRAHAEKLGAFGAGEARVLIGTQMVAKGLDFPNVTTVGVINADVALHLPDFRCRERTFQLLAQVAGRTGRGPAGGRVIVQTFMPDDPSIRAAAGHDYQAFAEYELPLRRELGYPPYSRLVRIICRGRKPERVARFAAELGAACRRLCPEIDERIRVLGPAPAPRAQLRGRHRRHLLIKCPDARAVREFMEGAKGLMKGPSGVKVVVDVDPISML